jgi:glycosyltransferase involved in cell wall biosynthesis
MPKVSVLIPCYNHEKYVSEAIESILNQTYQNFEIVITDDGSDDDTFDRGKEFNDSRIKTFRFDENRGAVAAVKNCFDNACGEYIAILSSDDVFLAEKLEKQVKILENQSEIGAVFSLAQIIDKMGNDFVDESHYYYRIFFQPNRTRFEWLHDFFYEGNCLCHSSVLVRRSCYDEIGFYDYRLTQSPDIDFWIRLCLRYEIYVIQENLVKFRVMSNEANISGIGLEKDVRKWWEAEQVLRRFLKIRNAEDFLKIFPEGRRWEGRIDDDLIRFFVAMIALDADTYIHYRFGLNTLFEIMNDHSIISKLQKLSLFSYKDFAELSSKDKYIRKILVDSPRMEKSMVLLQQKNGRPEKMLNES